MAKFPEITINLDEEAYEVIRATRLQVCTAVDCVHNTVKHDIRVNRAECMLKRTSIGENGMCERFTLDGEAHED